MFAIVYNSLIIRVSLCLFNFGLFLKSQMMNGHYNLKLHRSFFSTKSFGLLLFSFSKKELLEQPVIDSEYLKSNRLQDIAVDMFSHISPHCENIKHLIQFNLCILNFVSKRKLSA